MNGLLTKITIVEASIFIAVSEVVNELTDSANKVGTLGMQGLLAFMLIVLGLVIWHLEKKRTLDRDSRDKLLEAHYNNLLQHHNDFAEKATLERNAFHAKMETHSQDLRALTERSIVAMHAMATSTEALREWLKENSKPK